MLRIFALLLLVPVLLLGCDSSEEQEEEDPLLGVWTLDKVQGEALPHVLSASEYISAGSLTFTSTGWALDLILRRDEVRLDTKISGTFFGTGAAVTFAVIGCTDASNLFCDAGVGDLSMTTTTLTGNRMTVVFKKGDTPYLMEFRK